jgi:hypothetical protein
MIRHKYIKHFQFSTHTPHNECDTINANVSASRPSCCHKELALPFKLVSEQSIKKKKNSGHSSDKLQLHGQLSL